MSNAFAASIKDYLAVTQTFVNATGFGVGITPAYKFDVLGNSRFSGSVGVGANPTASFVMRLGRPLTGSTYVRNCYAGGEVQPDVTSGGTSVETNLQLADGVVMSGNWQHFSAQQGSFGTGTLAVQYGFHAANTLTGATNNYGFYSNLAAATGRWNFYAAGTAANYFGGDVQVGAAGNLTVIGSGTLGYATGAGGSVTQATSRTTGVTLNKAAGAITLFTAAGSTAATTFTVTNSTVAATDTIVINQKSGTNLYLVFITAVAAGSFNVTFYTTGGTASDAPVLNFAVVKAVTA